MERKLLSFITAVFLLVMHTTAQDEPLGILLTWTEDPTTTISIDWHTLDQQPEQLHYREKGETGWQEEKSSTHPFPFSERFVHRVILKQLTPGTSYEIKFGLHDKIYWFSTMPLNAVTEPIRIAIGGDTMHEKEMLERTNCQVLEYDPHFVVMGGDMAYENGVAKNVGRVYDWFDAVKNTLITPENKIIPVVAGIGNHEVAGGYYSKRKFSGSDEDREKYAPYFYNLFAFPGQPGYNVLDFGNYLSLFILDSGHTNPIRGKQTDWLKTELQKRGETEHIIPVYHIPAYPSVRRAGSSRPKKVRRHWLPLFEEHNVRLAFENHDHAYKRTHPIKNNKIDENGIVFIGDGAWGVRVRRPKSAKRTWYLEKAMAQRHFVLLTLQGTHQQIMVINEDGETIDSYPETE